MGKALIIVEVDLDDGNLQHLRKNQDKLTRSLGEDIQGAISWYGDPRARIKELSITLGAGDAVPAGLCKAAYKSLKEMSVTDKTHWVKCFLKELDEYDADSCDVLERVHTAIEFRVYMGMGW
jgi:hypothetical protein